LGVSLFGTTFGATEEGVADEVAGLAEEEGLGIADELGFGVSDGLDEEIIDDGTCEDWTELEVETEVEDIFGCSALIAGSSLIASNFKDASIVGGKFADSTAVKVVFLFADC
jgi:hypothetical protein